MLAYSMCANLDHQSCQNYASSDSPFGHTLVVLRNPHFPYLSKLLKGAPNILLSGAERQIADINPGARLWGRTWCGVFSLLVGAK